MSAPIPPRMQKAPQWFLYVKVEKKYRASAGSKDPVSLNFRNFVDSSVIESTRALIVITHSTMRIVFLY